MDLQTKNKKTPKVSVVMSNYNGHTLKLIDNSLSSILKNNYKNLEVIVIDNASTDDSVSFIKKKYGKNKRLKLIENKINMYSLGLNLGIKNANGKYIAFFNNDATVDNGYFQTFISFLEKNKHIGLAQGKLLAANNHALIDCVGETMDIFGNPTSIGHGEKALGNFTTQTDILSVSGSCSMLRKSIVDDIGYFDEDFGIGYEDMDLSLRARKFGYDIVYFPNIYVYHKRGATDLADIVRIKVRWHFNKNRIMTIIKNYPLHLIITTLPVVVLIYSLAGFWEIMFQNKISLGLTRFTSMFWVLTHLSIILQKRKQIEQIPTKNNWSTIYQLMYKTQMLQKAKESLHI